MSKKINLCIITCMFFVWLLTFPAYAAEESLRITPVITNIQLIPGKVSSYTMTIENTADRPLGIQIQLSDSFDTQTTFHNHSLTPWIQLSEKTFIINPQESRKITVTITPPITTTEGGYYASLFFTPFISNQNELQKPVILTRIGTLILGTIGNMNYHSLAEKTDISSISINNIQDTLPIPINFSVTNNYFTHFTAKPFLTIYPLLGDKKTIEFPEQHILPGTTKIWNESIKNISTDHFLYKARLAISIGQGHYLYKETFFVIFPYKSLIIIVYLLLFIACIWYIRKRLKQAIQILLSKGN